MTGDAADWFQVAADDLADAEALVRHARWKAAAFHCQQAAEKALKAVILSRGDRIPRIHDLFELARRAGAPAAIEDACAELSPTYITSRYPGIADEATLMFTAEEIERLLTIAREVNDWCHQQVP